MFYYKPSSDFGSGILCAISESKHFVLCHLVTDSLALSSESKSQKSTFSLQVTYIQNIDIDITVSSRFAESHFAESRFAECRVSFSFHHFHFKFFSLMRYNLFMGVNKMHVKILLLLCRLGLVLRLGSI